MSICISWETHCNCIKPVPLNFIVVNVEIFQKSPLKLFKNLEQKFIVSPPLKLLCRRNLAFHWDCRSVCHWGTWKLHPISARAADGSVSCFTENGEYLPWNIHKLPEAKFHSGNSEISLYITFLVLTKVEIPPPVGFKYPWSRWWWIGTAGCEEGAFRSPGP